MSERAVHLKEIAIHRVPGIERGAGFKLEGLSPGINLVHGPNGVGKSVTARVIQELLWPGYTGLPGPTVSGRLADGGDKWRVEIDAGHVTIQRDDGGDGAPEWGPAELARRYHLALHELAQERDERFAKAIADASRGGYDLRGACEALGYRDKPPPHSRERRELEECRARVDKARGRQREIEREATRLEELRREREDATAAQEELEALRKAKQFHEAADELREAQVRLQAFPDGVARLRGDERKRLDRLEKYRLQMEGELQQQEQQRERAEREIGEANLPRDGIQRGLIDQLRASIRELREIESKLEQQRGEWNKAWAEVESAQRRLGGRFTEEQLRALDSVEVEGISAFARKAEQARVQRKAQEARRRFLEQKEPEEVRGLDPGRLMEGIGALSRWLASGPGGTVSEKGRLSFGLALVAALMLSGLGVILAFGAQWPFGAAAIVAGVIIAVVAIWKKPATATVVGSGDERVVHEKTYASTELPRPEAWETSAVSTLLKRLIELAAKRSQADEWQRELKAVEAEAQALASEEAELDQEREVLAERLGLTIELGEEWLPSLVENLRQWQRAGDGAARGRAEVDRLTEQWKSVLTDINDRLDEFGYAPADGAEAAERLAHDLENREARRTSALKESGQAWDQIEKRIRPALEDVKDQRRNLFAELKLDEADETQLGRWLEQKEDFEKLKHEEAKARAIVEDRRTALADHPKLLAKEAAELDPLIEEKRRQADRRDALSEEFARIENEIESAKRGHALSEALEALEAAEARMAEAREADSGAVTGALLADWVRRTAVEQSRPQVFRRANELLARFTHGTLQLDIDERGKDPEFRAHRVSEPPRPVSDLSVGERVQLLMAVRVAFLEQDERARLPLLLDEALGTSDDARAGAIIDSLIELARAGRQVFYFTAQQDEVGKWAARLRDVGVAHQIIDLAQVRRMAESQARPLEIAEIDPPEPQAPEGMDYEAYGCALNVPAMDPATDQMGDLHLWHFLDDARALHGLLRRRISTWGQLRTLLDHGGAGLVEADPKVIAHARAAARAIDAACAAWREGRGKPVDRGALQDSGAVSGAFMDELTELAAHCGGDAAQVIERLEQGKVKRWRSDKTEALRRFFEENGHLPGTRPFSQEELRARTLAAVAAEVRSGMLEHAWVDRLLARLP